MRNERQTSKVNIKKKEDLCWNTNDFRKVGGRPRRQYGNGDQYEGANDINNGKAENGAWGPEDTHLVLKGSRMER